MKKVISLILVIFGIFNMTAYAANTPSKWAQDAVSAAWDYDIVSESAAERGYTSDITRAELCIIILRIYNFSTGLNYSAKGASPFADTDDGEIVALYELGIASGLDNGLFEPERGVTRQEIAKFFTAVYAAASGADISADKSNIKKFTDFDKIGSWAYPYIAFLMDLGAITGYEDGSFKPQNNVTVEQALVLAVRLAEALPKKLNPVGAVNYLSPEEAKELKSNKYARDVKIISQSTDGIKLSSDGQQATISFGGSGSYEISITEQRNSYYEGEIEARPYIRAVSDSGEYTFLINPVRIYKVSVTGNGVNGYAEFITARPDSDKNSVEVESFGEITTEEEAKALQQEIEVPVWRIVNGEKVSGKAYLTVHKAIADKVKMIFEEIYNGNEKFPIVDVGGYYWRAPMGSGRLSEHNIGTAIDINADQNYCLYSSGTAVGSCWKPYEDPYSITPYGEVINIFEKYGFTWGGDAWRNPKDYMHFSYMGT